MKKTQHLKWIYLLILSVIWGSSFILIKKGLVGLTPVQLGALRILFAGIFLIIIGFKSLKEIKKRHWKPILLSALSGTFFPAFLFAYAISGINSSVVSILNSVTPFNALWIGFALFGFQFNKKQLIGIVIGLIGTVILILNGADFSENKNYWYALLPIMASIGYGFNVNVIKKHLHDLNPLPMAVGSFVLILIPTLLVLVFSGFFTSFELTENTKPALLYILILSVAGTSIAKIIFNRLVVISSPVFSASVTYLIPLVAVMWGFLDGEKLTAVQFFAGGIILLGVWLVNKIK